jgi:hypothetical protein
MRTKLVVLLVACLFVLGAYIAFRGVRAQTQSAGGSADEQVRSTLSEFLSNVDKPSAHEKFWSDQLVYTGASGKVRTKSEIVKSVTEAAAKPADPKEPKSSYDAEDVKVKDYADFAIVNFHLVAHTEKDGKAETMNFRNTGTLHKENGQWKVIAWQATRIEEPKPEEKK